MTLEAIHKCFCKSKSRINKPERFYRVDHLANSLKSNESMNWLVDLLLC